jgi:hypothetical protein
MNTVRISVSVPDEARARIEALARLEQQLEVVDGRGFAEIWIDHMPYPSLCALVNGSSGWLMYVRSDGDPGFSSRNPSYSGDPKAMIEYDCAGQQDWYPAAWALPRDRVLAALKQFAERQTVPESIVWFNDSRDGTAGPGSG